MRNSSSVVEVGSCSLRFVGLGSFWLLLALHLGVLDVDSVFVNVSLLVVGPELPVSVTLDEDVVVVGSDGDVVVEFLDILIIELMEEVDDKSSGDFVDFNPRRMNGFLFGLGDSLGLITINLKESLGFNNVETEVVVFPDRLFSWSHTFD